MLSSMFTIVVVYIICICNILSLLVSIYTGEDFISLQLVSYISICLVLYDNKICLKYWGNAPYQKIKWDEILSVLNGVMQNQIL
jgi:hypothetical protein